MKSIFENAYFGKSYKTRDGRKAIILQKTFELDGMTLRGFIVATNDWHCTYTSYPIDLEGKIQCWSHQRPEDLCDDSDIVSEWQEEINEEELDKLAEEEYPYEYNTSLYGNEECEYKNELREAYKSGYYKAYEIIK